MRISCLIATLLLSLRQAHAGGGGAGPVVSIADGQLRGIIEGTTQVFRGIPFAAPPVDDLRWRPPTAHPKWRGVRDAAEYGSMCVQDTGAGSEDCLFLNVYAPVAPPAPLPVMIFVHGGSYKSGSGNLNLTKMVQFANDSVILVTTNYRLNIFGFAGSTPLRSRDRRLTAEGTPLGSTGNYGIQDQRAAFAWVRDNIAAWGGAGDQITIFGESAGAGSMSNHLSQQASWGLFQGVILESGSFSQWTANPMTASAQSWGAATSAAGCTEPEGSLMSSPVDCMVALNTSAVVAAMQTVPKSMGLGYLSWAPTIDGVELLDAPWNLVQQQKVAPVPILHGTNRDEGSMFIGKTDPALSHDDAQRYLTAQYGPVTGDMLLDLYASNYTLDCPTAPAYSPGYCAVLRSFGYYLFGCAARHATRSLSGRDVWLYYFSPNLTAHGFPLIQHASELQFVFQQLNSRFPQPVQDLAAAITSYWVNFARFQNPNGLNYAQGPTSTLPVWAKDDGSGGRALFLDVETSSGVHLVGSLKDAECGALLEKWTDARLNGRYWRPAA